MTPPLLSVVICTYNREGMLARALLSVCRQTLDSAHYEVIVVDNNSRDRTRRTVEQCAGTYPNVRYLLETRQGLSHARNAGADAARGEYLLYMDDDAIAPSEYLENVRRALEANRPDILGGPIYPFYFDPKPRWFRDEWEIRRYAKRSGFATTGGISGSNYVIRRDLLPRLGMFDPSLGMCGGQLGLGEDRKVLETYRATVPLEQQRVYYALECPMLHLAPSSKLRFGYMIRRHFAAGRLAVTVKGRGNTVSEVARAVRELPRIVFVKHLDVRRVGWRGIDVLGAIRRVVFELGFVHEAFRQMALRSVRYVGERRRFVPHVSAK